MKRNSILNYTLSRALSMKRPHKGIGEKLMLDWLADHLPTGVGYMMDSFGNMHVDLRGADPQRRTLFVAHVDTVHHTDGPNKIRKTRNKWYANGAPLGADDGAGIALLMQLIHRGVPAYYVFTVGEECGGQGAKFLARNHEPLLRQFDRAIAFDRRGIDSVITHQGWGRCCSDVFAAALSDALNQDERLMYLPDDTGVYTDTAEFVDTIPECTNISCGYQFEHSDREELDVRHLVTLANRICAIDWDGLPTERDPLAIEPDTYATSWAFGGSYYDKGVEATSVNSFYDDADAEWDRQLLRDAIYDAMVGQPHDLIDLMCDSVYPEEPALVRRYISTRKLTDEMLEEMLKQTAVYDADTILCTMYDALYTGA